MIGGKVPECDAKIVLNIDEDDVLGESNLSGEGCQRQQEGGVRFK